MTCHAQNELQIEDLNVNKINNYKTSKLIFKKSCHFGRFFLEMT